MKGARGGHLVVAATPGDSARPGGLSPGCPRALGGWIPAQPQGAVLGGPCPRGTGVLQASCDTCSGDGGLVSCMHYHGPTSCTHVLHPTSCTPQTVYIPPVVYSSSPGGSLLAGLPQTLTRSAPTGTGIRAAKQLPHTPATFPRSRRHTPSCTVLAQHPAVPCIPNTAGCSPAPLTHSTHLQ